MAARAIWKGDLKLNSTKVPVKLYSAVQDQTVRFHILDAKTKTRVKQHMVSPETREEVANEEIRKGFEVEPGTFVILDEEELKSLEPEASREIEIEQFVPRRSMFRSWIHGPQSRLQVGATLVTRPAVYCPTVEYFSVTTLARIVQSTTQPQTYGPPQPIRMIWSSEDGQSVS